MIKKLWRNRTTKVLIQTALLYSGVALTSQIMMMVTAMLAPYVISLLLIVIAVLYIKMEDSCE